MINAANGGLFQLQNGRKVRLQHIAGTAMFACPDFSGNLIWRPDGTAVYTGREETPAQEDFACRVDEGLYDLDARLYKWRWIPIAIWEMEEILSADFSETCEFRKHNGRHWQMKVSEEDYEKFYRPAPSAAMGEGIKIDFDALFDDFLKIMFP